MKSMMEQQHEAKANEKVEYRKFATLIGGLLLLSILLAQVLADGNVMAGMNYFMGLFFLTLGSFKLWNLESFVDIFRTYDILAKKYPAYAYVYPIIQIIFGTLYSFQANTFLLNGAVVVISMISYLGVRQGLAKRRNHTIQCACLGGVIKLPLSKITAVEDIAMAFMAAINIIYLAF